MVVRLAALEEYQCGLGSPKAITLKHGVIAPAIILKVENCSRNNNPKTGNGSSPEAESSNGKIISKGTRGIIFSENFSYTS
jgi:hypothetical protein